MDAFRNFVRGWFGKVFLGLVILVFVVTMFWNVTPPGSQGELVKVNDERIYKAELDQAVESVMARYGNQLDRRTLEKLISRDAVLDTLVRQKATIDAARELGVIADPAAVQELVRSIPAFHDESGKFSQERFQQALSRGGFASAAAFLKRLETDLISDQVQGALADSAFATRQDLEMLTRMGEQKRDLAWVALAPSMYARDVTVTDADVQARYDANPGAWLTEEKFAVNYLELRLDDYLADQSVADDAVRAKYDDMVRKAGENAERRLAHILIAINQDRDAKAAQARVDEVIERLAKGESFATLAVKYSDDQGSAASGGDLGYLGRGVLEPAQDSAVAALKVNDVSPAIQAGDGLHLFKVLDIRQVQVPSFESSKPGIVAALKRDTAKAKFDDVVGELGTLAYESDNLTDPAEKLGLQVRSSGLFGREGGAGIAGNPKVLDEILAPEVLEEGRNSGVIEIGDGHVVVVHLKEHQPAQRRPFEEVAGQVRAELIREKAAAVAKEKVAALKVALVAGQPIEQLAAGLAVQRAVGASRATGNVPREVLQAAFEAKRPADGAVSVETAALGDGSQAVIAVSNVVDGTLLGIDEMQLQMRRSQLAGEFGRYDYQRFTDSALASAEIVRAGSKKEEKGVIDLLKDIKNQVRRP